MKLRHLNLDNHPILGNLKANFCDSKGNPLDTIVFYGDNGCGKTTLLKEIFSIAGLRGFPVQALGYNFWRIEEPSKQDTDSLLFEKSDEEWSKNFLNWQQDQQSVLNKEKKGVNLRIFTKVIFVPTEINFQNPIDSSKPDFTTNLKVEKKFAVVIDNDISSDIKSYISTRVLNLLTNDRNLPSGKAQDSVCDEINGIFDILDLNVKLDSLSSNSNTLGHPLFKNSFGAVFDIDSLSSGEKQLFLRALTIRMYEPEDAIILIDEPELSMHPKWQQRIVSVYRKLAPTCQIIIATHSPLIIGSVHNDSAFVLKREDETKTVTVTNYGDYGQPASNILGLMGLKTLRDPDIQEEIDALKKMIRLNNYKNEEFENRYTELKTILGEDDPSIMVMNMEMKILTVKQGTNVKS